MKIIEKEQSSELVGGRKSCLELRLRSYGAWQDGNDRRGDRLYRRADRRGCGKLKFPIDLLDPWMED